MASRHLLIGVLLVVVAQVPRAPATDPARKVREAGQGLTDREGPARGQGPICGAAQELRIVALPAGVNAREVARTLQAIYQGVWRVRIAAVGRSKIMVWAGPEDQAEIAKQVSQLRGG
jgi:hypothetical protein